MTTFLIYLFTRLDTLSLLSALAAVALGLVLLACCAISIIDDGCVRGSVLKLAWPFSLALACTVLIPTQKDAAIILGGTAIIEAAQTDQAKRMASKSVEVIERLLDQYLAGNKVE